MDYKIVVEGLTNTQQARQLTQLLQLADPECAVNITVKTGVIDIHTTMDFEQLHLLLQQQGCQLVDAELQ